MREKIKKIYEKIKKWYHKHFYTLSEILEGDWAVD